MIRRTLATAVIAIAAGLAVNGALPRESPRPPLTAAAAELDEVTLAVPLLL